MSCKVRKLIDSDLPAIAELLNSTYSDSYQFVPLTEKGLRSWVKESKLEVVVAERKGVILGSASYHDGFWGEEVEWLGVRDTSDKTDIKDMLVREVERYVKKGAVSTSVDAESPKNRRMG